MQRLMLVLWLLLSGLALLPWSSRVASGNRAAPAGPDWQVLINALEARKARGEPPLALCFANPVPPEVEAAVEAALRDGAEFQLGARWTSTTLSGSGLGQGSPTTLTYSFVPDGTPINGSVGEPAAPSNLLAAFNPVFGSEAAWKNLVHATFTNWGALTGITYVFEPNDDGVLIGSAAGQAGVRGDVRISGHLIDGASNILAYNNFPNNGDMVLDTGDTGLFGNGSNNFRIFRNVVSHEHGHGIGLAHVCPGNSTKLMEPLLATAFDGPQFDDISGAQRHYGDNFEPNDTAGTATDLGTLGNGTTVRTTLSIDDNADVDFWRFTTTTPKRVTVTVTPLGSIYNQAAQTNPCGAGTAFDPRNQNDLGIQILANNGSTVLSTANAQPAGGTESIVDQNLNVAGNYHVRVFGGGNDAAQMHSLSLVVADAFPFELTIPAGIPDVLPAGSTSTVLVRVVPGFGNVDPLSGQLFASIGTGAFVSSPLVSLGGNDYQATLPAANCLSIVRWYVRFTPLGGGAFVTSPGGAPTNTHASTAESGAFATVFFDNFETNLGWTVTNDAALTGGAWERGTPIGGGARGDPPTDGDGSGQCFLTQNLAGNSDVDGGTTTVTSPLVNMSGAAAGRLVVRFWLDNDFGGNPNTEPLHIEASNNGGTSWVTLESYNANAGVWIERDYFLTGSLAPTSQMRVRFRTQDPPPGAVVEAGVDAVRFLVCAELPALGLAAAGTAPSPVLTINGSASPTTRRVDVASGSPISLGLAQPPSNPSPAGFLLFARFGVPSPVETTAIPPLGSMVFPPCGLFPSSPVVIMFADSFASNLCGPPVVPASPTPFNFSIPTGIPFPVQFTFQGVIEVGPGALAITNALVLNVTP